MTDAQGAPADGTLITLAKGGNDLTTWTGSSGAFHVINVPPGQYAIRATREGQASPVAVVDLASGMNAPVDLVVRSTGTIRGRVMAGTEPLSGAWVIIPFSSDLLADVYKERWQTFWRPRPMTKATTKSPGCRRARGWSRPAMARVGPATIASSACAASEVREAVDFALPALGPITLEVRDADAKWALPVDIVLYQAEHWSKPTAGSLVTANQVHSRSRPCSTAQTTVWRRRWDANRTAAAG